MKSFISKPLAFCVVVLLVVSAWRIFAGQGFAAGKHIQTAVTIPSPSANRNHAGADDTDGPMVDYQSADGALGLSSFEDQVKRHSKNSRYDRAQPAPIQELQEGEPLPVINHWWLKMPGIPVSRSDAVVLGTVSSSRAYLSNDKCGVYSEFQLRSEQILKDATKSLVVGGNIVAVRSGGIVRFPDGKTQKYSISRQGWPRKGRRYVLFLSRNEYGDFDIVTGYELRDGITYPLDGNSKPGANETSFHAYSGMSEAGFLEAVQTALKGGIAQ